MIPEHTQQENILCMYYKVIFFKWNSKRWNIHYTEMLPQSKITPQWKNISNFYSIYPTVGVWLSWLLSLHLPGVSFPVLWIFWLTPCSQNWLRCPSWGANNPLSECFPSYETSCLNSENQEPVLRENVKIPCSLCIQPSNQTFPFYLSHDLEML